jgi:hypothetical protein
MSQTDLSRVALEERISDLEADPAAGGDVADLQVGLLYASLTAAAEAGNVRTVAIQVKDFTGTNVAAAVRFHCQLFDANMLAAVTASWRLAETGAGSEVTATAKASLIIQTDANGAATVSVTDVGGASNTTVYLKVSPLLAFGRDEYVALTFDNA